MITHTFKLPKRFDMAAALTLARQFLSVPPSDPVEIDFAGVTFTQPFSMLYFCSQLRRLINERPQSSVMFSHYEHLGYLAHMGFFKACGIEFGKDPGQAAGSPDYVPLTRLTIRDLEDEAADQYEDPRETIERRSGKLATILARAEDGDLHETLTYALREIFRNVFEHSNADAIWYAAQCWSGLNLVELAIFDEGDGIAASLARNPHLSIASDQEALHLAILPGISGVAFKGARQKRNDAWANSGYGLFMTSQLCQRGSSFVIASGKALLEIKEGKTMDQEIDYPGTAIRLRFKTDRMEDLSQSLEGLRKMGAEIAGTISTEANLSASMSSRMLMLKEKN